MREPAEQRVPERRAPEQREPARRAPEQREPARRAPEQREPARRLSPAAAQRLQGSAGNRAVSRLVATPGADPKFAALKGEIRSRQRRLTVHRPPAAEAAAARGAAKPPQDGKEAYGKAANAERMNAAKPGEFDKAAFVKAVDDAIAAQAPKNLAEAAEFGSSGRAAAVKDRVAGQVTDGRRRAAGAIESATKAPPDTSRVPDKPVTPLVPDAPPPVPSTPDPAKAVPDRAPPEATDLSAGPRQVDDEMARAEVTEEQLARSNEPEFTDALAAKREGEAHATTAPGRIRAAEATTLAGTRGQAATAGTAAMAAMAADRRRAGAAVTSGKTAAKAADEARQAEVTAKLGKVFDATKRDVEQILTGLDRQVDDAFTRGEKAARDAFTAEHTRRMAEYKDRRYSGLRGKYRWVRDKFRGLPEEANQIFAQARAGYTARMRQVISSVADLIGAELGRAKRRITEGRAQLQAEITKLPKDQQALARKAATGFAARFDELDDGVDSRGSDLVQTLAGRYTEAVAAVDAEIEAEKEKNKGLIDRALDAVVGVVRTILQLKDLLLGVLARAAGVIGSIISDPIGFLGNLVGAVKTGVVNFADNIVDHLGAGLKSWLLGNLASAGVEVPERLDARGILRLVLSLLGLTWANVKSRILRFIPEPVLDGLERTLPVVGILFSEGLPGLWRWVAEKVGDLTDLVLGQIREFVVEKIVKAGITWIISLLNPAAAFIKACKAIYDVVMFFIERAAQVREFVDAVLDSVESIARGGVGAVAGLIEKALGRAVPLVLGMLASLLGLGGVSDKIRSVLETVAKPVNGVIDAVVGTVVKAGRRLWATMRRGGAAVASGVRNLGDAFLARLMGRRGVTMKGAPHTVFLKEQGGRHVVMMASAERRLASKIHNALGSDAVRAHPEIVGHLQSVQATVARYEAGIVRYKFEQPDTREANRLERELEAYSEQMISQLAEIGRVFDLDVLSGGAYVLDGHVHPRYQTAIRRTFYGSSSDYEHLRPAKRQEAIEAKRLRYPDPMSHPDMFWCPGYPRGNRYPHLAALSVLELDHREGAASHWKRRGHDCSQAERHEFFTSGANIEALCASCNRAKQSDGDHYDTAVGAGFSGPGGLR